MFPSQNTVYIALKYASNSYSPKQDETNGCYSGSSDVVVHIRNLKDVQIILIIAHILCIIVIHFNLFAIQLLQSGNLLILSFLRIQVF